MNNKRTGKERRKYVRTSIDKHEITIHEKRKYIRLNYKEHFDFTVCTHNIGHTDADSVNISQNGILFKSNKPISKGTFLVLNVDKSHIKEHIEISKLLHEKSGELIGQVVRSEKDTDNNDTYLIGVAFLLQGL